MSRISAVRLALILLQLTAPDTFSATEKKLLVSTGAGLTTIGSEIGLNNQGTVAFTGTDSGGSAAFTVGGSGTVTKHTFQSANRTFGTSAVLNDQSPPQIAVRDRVSGSTPAWLVRTWSADGSLLWKKIGSSLDGNFDSATFRTDINNSGTVVFAGLTGGSTITPLFAGTSQASLVAVATFSGVYALYPQISEDDVVVVQDPSNRIVTYSYPSGAVEIIASVPSSFADTGRSPGIAPTRIVVAFSGDRGAGEGLFVGVKGTNGRSTHRIAGEGVDGISDIDFDHRVGVTCNGSLATGLQISLVFRGVSNGIQGIHMIDCVATEVNGVVSCSSAAPQLLLSESGTTILSLPGGGSTTKTVSTASLYDPINLARQVAIFAQFSDGTSGIVRAGPELGDFAIQSTSLMWNTKLGGLDVQFTATGTPSTQPSTAKVFWGSGSSIGNAIQPPVFSASIPVGFTGTSEKIRVLGPTLRNAPAGTTHILLVLDKDNSVFESDEGNNLLAIPDATANFPTLISEYSRGIVRDAMRYAGEADAEVTSTYRPSSDQARVMFEVLEGPVTAEMTKKNLTTTVAYSYALYGPSGDSVVSTYVASKAASKTDIQIKADMTARIDLIKSTNPGAFRHTTDFAKLQVLDIAKSSVTNPRLFHKATSRATDPRISLRYSPYSKPYDRAFHVEIPQPALPILSPEYWVTVDGGSAVTASTATSIPMEDGDQGPSSGGGGTASSGKGPKGPIVNSPPMGPLSPAVLLALVDNEAVGTAAVANGHQVFSFEGAAGLRMTAGLSVTATLIGDNDTVLWLFDPDGRLLLSNDDTDPFESDFQSLIEGVELTRPGVHYLVVTTWGNAPIFGPDGIITGWQDDGSSSITFDLALQLLPLRLQIRRASDEMGVVEWSEDGVLQSGDTLSGPWLDMPSESSPHYFFYENSRKFFRLRTP